MSAPANQNFFFLINNVTTSKQKKSRELQINKVYVRSELLTLTLLILIKGHVHVRFPHFCPVWFTIIYAPPIISQINDSGVRFH